MTTLPKLLMLMMAFGISLTATSLPTKHRKNYYDTATNTNGQEKTKAIEILSNKCNVCHKKRNRRRVFTADNMDTWAKDVYKQVFVKKRMPKGKNIKLTTAEYQDLLTWINSTKN